MGTLTGRKGGGSWRGPAGSLARPHHRTLARRSNSNFFREFLLGGRRGSRAGRSATGRQRPIVLHSWLERGWYRRSARGKHGAREEISGSRARLECVGSVGTSERS